VSIDWLSEKKYNRLKEKTMDTKKKAKKKIKKKKRKSKKKKKK